LGWIWLAVTIAFEVTGSTMMKLAKGFSEFWPSLMVFVCYGASIAGLTMVLKTIELSVAYAIWSGVGTALIACIGVAFFGESLTPIKITSLLLIIAGVVGLNLGGQAR